eukprot:TRINITY_DN17329_c0_g1_i1.p1 TRINITY_DN17329_c0_g1~~TRINITY_DN17329_c0_g1_i1.p1  ORF type:complete len:58 (+),score=3.74 TRINITY_DN17329_c0_g1_i1:155-328(+)
MFGALFLPYCIFTSREKNRFQRFRTRFCQIDCHFENQYHSRKSKIQKLLAHVKKKCD